MSYVSAPDHVSQLDLLQFIIIFLAPGSPELDTILQMWFDTCRTVTERLTFLDLPQLVLFHHKGTLPTHTALLHQFSMSFSTALLSNHKPVLLHRYFPTQILKLSFAHDELHEVSLNPFFQPDKVLLKSIPTLPYPYQLLPLHLVLSTNLRKLPFFPLSR